RIGRALIHQGLLMETTDGYPVLRLNELSMEVLRKERKVEMVAIIKPEQKRQSKNNDASDLQADDDELFQRLRALRKRIADELNVAPYVVFADLSLRSMAQRKPQTRAQFAQIPGVGSNKLDMYSEAFMNEIRDYRREKSSQRPKNYDSSVNGGMTHQLTLSLYRQGLSIEEIASQRNLKSSTISSHLTELVEAGEAIDINRLVKPEHYNVIVDALRQIGDEFLKPVKDFLGDEYSYEEIRLVRAALRRAR
ncbi:MAG TPA: helix-turn-helix domain-containing protein, partial [Ktedonobacteraceae bacterium]|nr:helix-turn-helix domain-containing protein [Ktedonobacteraceae bacterium]